MIISHSLNTAPKFLLIFAALLFVSGCSTIADPTSPASKAAARIQAEPGPDRLVRYCRRMAETKNLRIAIGICERALAAAPENPEPVIILAEAYLDADYASEAAEAYRFALSIDSNSGEAHFGLGKIYLRDSKLEEARPHLEAALRDGQQDPAIFNALGVLEDQSGRHTAAQGLYQAGLALDPENTALANNLGVSLLLSKPSEIGDSIFGHLAPEQRPDRTAKSISPAREKVLARTLATEPAPSVTKSSAVAVATVPELVQTDTNSLFNFFKDSRALDPNLQDPVISPAPVEIVNFQALPALRAQPSTKAREDENSAALLARALLDYDPAQSDAPDQPAAIIASASEDPSQPIQHVKSKFDLASVKPGRNPFVKGLNHDRGSSENSVIVRAAAPTPPPARHLLLAQIPHLPIEMPQTDTAPGLEDQSGRVTDNKPTTAPQAQNPLPSDLRIIETNAPNLVLEEDDIGIRSDILTDVILPDAGTPVFLQHDNDRWKEVGESSSGTDQAVIRYDGIGALDKSDAQNDVKPDLLAPDAELFFWPNSLADRQLPLNVPSPPSGPDDRVMALLLNRSITARV